MHNETYGKPSNCTSQCGKQCIPLCPLPIISILQLSLISKCHYYHHNFFSMKFLEYTKSIILRTTKLPHFRLGEVVCSIREMYDILSFDSNFVFLVWILVVVSQVQWVGYSLHPPRKKQASSKHIIISKQAYCFNEPTWTRCMISILRESYHTIPTHKTLKKCKRIISSNTQWKGHTKLDSNSTTLSCMYPPS